MITLHNCPICKSTKLNDYSSTIDYSVSKEKFTLSQCDNCSLIFTNPLPDENEIGKYYQSENYISHTDTRKGLINTLYHAVRNYTLNKKVALIKKQNNNKKGKLLDIGCGTGYFLETAHRNNWEISGFEPDNTAREIANTKLNYKIVGKLEEVIDKEFDVISLWHVLEHIHQLDFTINKLKTLLKHNGTIIIAVPNIESWDSQYYKEKWAALDVPRHLYHFSKKSMMALAKQHQLNVIETKPMIFDSFYVSMISEKYKNNNKLGVTQILKSFIIGLISNIKGITTNNQSSTIYILKK